MIKILEAKPHAAEFDHPKFRLSMYRKAPTLGWEADLLVHAGSKEIQQLRLDLAEKLEQVAAILRSQEAAIIKTVVEAL